MLGRSDESVNSGKQVWNCIDVLRISTLGSLRILNQIQRSNVATIGALGCPRNREAECTRTHRKLLADVRIRPANNLRRRMKVLREMQPGEVRYNCELRIGRPDRFLFRCPARISTICKRFWASFLTTPRNQEEKESYVACSKSLAGNETLSIGNSRKIGGRWKWWYEIDTVGKDGSWIKIIIVYFIGNRTVVKYGRSKGHFMWRVI